MGMGRVAGPEPSRGRQDPAQQLRESFLGQTTTISGSQEQGYEDIKENITSFYFTPLYRGGWCFLCKLGQVSTRRPRGLLILSTLGF